MIFITSKDPFSYSILIHSAQSAIILLKATGLSGKNYVQMTA